MIDQLRHMAIFVRVVEEGSFRGAASALGLSPSRVSQAVSDLESWLGVTLLHRTTRKIALSSEGRMFHARAADMLRSAEAGLNELNALSLEPVGALRISLPAFLASSELSSAIGEFSRRHPHVALSIAYSDHRLGLMEDGFDMNVRAGWLDDSSMMSRKLGESERALVAGIDYAARHPAPTAPADLEEWDWIRYRQRSDITTLEAPDGQIVKVTGKSRLEVDNVEAMYHFACINSGATVLPEHVAARGVQAGLLTRLLPDWRLKPLGFYAVWPDSSRRQTLTRLLVQFLTDSLQAKSATTPI